MHTNLLAVFTGSHGCASVAASVLPFGAQYHAILVLARDGSQSRTGESMSVERGEGVNAEDRRGIST